jgi:hypothetical protein
MGSTNLELRIPHDKVNDSLKCVYQTNLFCILQLIRQLSVIFIEHVQGESGHHTALIKKEDAELIPDETWLRMESK